MTVTTRLDDLNKLLSKLDIPTHHKHVDTSGSNLPWLKKHVLGKVDDIEVNRLLSQNINYLLQPLTPVKELNTVLK